MTLSKGSVTICLLKIYRLLRTEISAVTHLEEGQLLQDGKTRLVESFGGSEWELEDRQHAR
jgi:hypothetical protein